MSWPQWPQSNIPQQSIAQQPIVNPAPNVSNPAATGQYSAEQWAQMQHQNWQQWVQWQQQFQLWQQQYGAEYQKSMSALAQPAAPSQPATSFMNVPPPPTEIKPPPPPDEPMVQPVPPPTPTTFSMNVPPPVPPVNYTSAPPPQVPNSAFPPNRNNPPPASTGNFPPYDGNNQQKFNRNQNYNRGPNANWQNQNQNRNQQPFNRFNQPPPIRTEQENKFDVGMKRPGVNSPDIDNTKRNKVENVETNKPEAHVSNRYPGEGQAPKPSTGGTEELSEAEKKFDKQFHDWEAQFQKWKQQNANHPDKEQYREYEKKWETWRSQLLDRREQMKRKRLGLSNTLTGDNPKKQLEQDRPISAQLTQQPTITNQSDSGSKSKLGEGLKSALPEVIPSNAPKSLTAGFFVPPPNLNNQPLDFKKSNEAFGIELQDENNQANIKSDSEQCDFLRSSTSGGIPGLDLVKDSTEIDDANEQFSPEAPKPDLEAISRGINSILGDRKFLNMLSLVSQNQNQNLSYSNTPTHPPKGDSPKFSPADYNQDDDDYENEHLKFEQLDNERTSVYESFASDSQNRLNLDPSAENSNSSGMFQRDRNDLNRNFGQFGKNDRSFKDFGRDGGQFQRDFSGFDNSSTRLGDFNRNQGNFGQTDNNPMRPGKDWNQGPAGNLNKDPNNFSRRGDNLNDSFNRPPPNLNRGTDDFNRTGIFNRGPDNFNRASNPDGFNRGPDKFNRGPDNFNRGPDNFNRGPDNFNRGPDNFNREPDNSNRGPDNFNRGLSNFNRRPDIFNRGPGNFNTASDSFNRPDNFNRTPNNFNRDSMPFTGRGQNFNRDQGPGNAFNRGGTFNQDNNVINKDQPFSKNFNMQQRPNIPPDETNRFPNRDFRSSARDFPNSCRNTEDFNKKSDLNQMPMSAANFRDNFDNKAPSNVSFDSGKPPTMFEKNYEDFTRGDFNVDGNKSSNIKVDDLQVPSKTIETLNSAEKGDFKQNIDEPEEDLGFWKTKTVIDYDHKSLVTEEIDVILEPCHTFDYRHKPLNRIPYPSRPTWLSEMISKYPEFDLINSRSSRPIDYRSYPPKTRFDSGYYKYEDRGRKPYEDRNRRIDDFDRKPYEDRGRKVSEDKDRRSFERGRKMYDDKDRRNYDDRDRKFEEKGRIPEETKKLDNKNISDLEHRTKNEKLFDSNFDDFDDEMDLDNLDIPCNKKDEDENKQPVTKAEETPTPSASKSNVMSIEDTLNPPGRYTRPPRIVIILRGPPGSGKSFLAKLIKDKEVENGGSAPRILCLDDYFMVEQEKEVEEDGRKVKVKEMVYEYEEGMEATYRQSLMRSFKKTITDGYFNFIIVDNINDKVKYFGEMWSFAKQNGFQVYICQMELDVQICIKRNIHGRSESEIEKCVSGWETTPSHHPVLDATGLIQSGSIPEVEMEEINSPSSDQLNEEERLIASKWDSFDYSVHNLAKLDGTNKPLRQNRTMEDYLQLDDEWVQPVSSKPGQKRVRWADLEERKQQEKMRAIGFVVGQTNWDRMMDPTMGSSALTQTKYIERYSKY